MRRWDEMEIIAAPEEHRKQYAHASLHLADELEACAGRTEPENMPLARDS